MSQFHKKNSQQNQENFDGSVIQEQPTIHQKTCVPPAVLGALNISLIKMNILQFLREFIILMFTYCFP